jgi:hypothetical protein
MVLFLIRASWTGANSSATRRHTGNIGTDPPGFEVELLSHLGFNKADFQKEIEVMREYRDKWVAHLDSELGGTYPHLDVPTKAVWFYHAYVVNHEAKPNDPTGDLTGLAADLEPEYQATEDDAKTVYRRFTKVSTLKGPEGTDS